MEDDEPTLPAHELDGVGGDAVNGQVGGKIATVSVVGTRGELRLFTPTTPEFGFVDKNDTALTVDPAGVLLAAAPELPWARVSAAPTTSKSPSRSISPA